MTYSPLISIGLCTYNSCLYLEEQLKSLEDQDYPNLELVVVDDQSLDETWDLLNHFRKKADIPTHLYRNNSNLGLNSSFAKAFELCSGEFIAPCDHDDIWFSKKISTLYREIGDRDAIFCDSEYINASGKKLGRARSNDYNLKSINNPKELIFSNIVSGHALLFDRRLREKCRPFDSQFFYDWWLAFGAANSKGIAYHPEVLVSYRIHEKNVSRPLQKQSRKYDSIEKNQKRMRIFCNMIKAEFTGPEEKEFLKSLLTFYQEKHQSFFFNFKHFFFLFRYRKSLYALLSKSRLKKIYIMFKDAMGLKFKIWCAQLSQ